MAFLLRRFGIGLVVLPIVFFLLVKHLFGGRRDVFGIKEKQRMPTGTFFPAKTSGGITKEQLAALFRVSGGRVTAEKLARAADVSIKTAKKFLDKQVVEGTITVEAGQSELIYLQKPEFNAGIAD
jgi:hypothetical protein